jgi:hypothetical protein
VNTPPKPLWLHAYSGRENGLMIVGTKDALHALGAQLLTATETPARESWPPPVATPQTVGPYAKVKNFSLSFHLEGSAPLAQVAPHRPSRARGLLYTAVAALAGVGALAIVKWVVTGAL